MGFYAFLWTLPHKIIALLKVDVLDSGVHRVILLASEETEVFHVRQGTWKRPCPIARNAIDLDRISSLA